MNSKHNVYVMYAIVFLQGFVFYGPVATIYRQARGLLMSEIFLIESIALVLILIFEVPWGWFADRYGYKRTLVIVNLLYFVSKIIFYQAQGFGGFLLERLILAMVIAGLSGCDTALICASIPPDRVQRVFGRYSAMGTLGFLLASASSSWIVKVSLDATAWLTIFPYGGAAILTFFLKEVHVEREKQVSIRENAILAFKDRQILFLVVAMALMVEVFQAVTVFLNQLQYQRAGIPVYAYGWILSGIQLVRFFSTKAESVTKRLGNRKTLLLLCGLVTFSCFSLIVTKNAIASVLCILLISVSLAVMGPVETDLKTRRLPAANRATILSIYSMTSSLIGAVCNVLVGKAADRSLILGLMTCMSMSVMAGVLLLFYRPLRE